MIERNIAVNFNQTLDLGRINRETARLLRHIRVMNVRFTRANYHFSLNNACHLERIRKHYDLLNFQNSDNVEFICMYGFQTTLAEDLERFRFLKSLPGAYVFTQRYRPFPGSPPPQTDRFFGNDPDPLIDELVRIIFRQNMKSMEKYYRWISRLDAHRYGRLHSGLVDTIFRYNQRELKGSISSLAGTRHHAGAPHVALSARSPSSRFSMGQEASISGLDPRLYVCSFSDAMKGCPQTRGV